MTDELRSAVGAVWLNHIRQGQGDPLLLLHSLGGSLVQWSPVMEQLAAEREVIAIDMPGFGESPSLPDGVSPRAANLATAVLDFYDALGIDGKPAVAGISLGGWVAIECARRGRRGRGGRTLHRGLLEAVAGSVEPHRCTGEGGAVGPARVAPPDDVHGSGTPSGTRPLHPPAGTSQPRRGGGDRQGLRDRPRLSRRQRPDAGRADRGPEGDQDPDHARLGGARHPGAGTGRSRTGSCPSGCSR